MEISQNIVALSEYMNFNRLKSHFCKLEVLMCNMRPLLLVFTSRNTHLLKFIHFAYNKGQILSNHGRLYRNVHGLIHGLRTPREEKAFTAGPKIHSHSQIFRYGRSIFCLPLRPNFSDIFDLCLHRVSVVRGLIDTTLLAEENYFKN